MTYPLAESKIEKKRAKAMPRRVMARVTSFGRWLLWAPFLLIVFALMAMSSRIFSEDRRD